MEKITLKVTGMHCKSCETLISDALADVGVKSQADSKKGTAVVEFNESKISLEKIKSIIAKGGYKVI